MTTEPLDPAAIRNRLSAAPTRIVMCCDRFDPQWGEGDCDVHPAQRVYVRDGDTEAAALLAEVDRLAAEVATLRGQRQQLGQQVAALLALDDPTEPEQVQP